MQTDIGAWQGREKSKVRSMEFFIGIALALGVGFATAAQGPTNAAMGLHVGAVQGALVSFTGGLAILGVLCAIIGEGNIFAALTVPWWQLLGGVYAAFIVFVMALCSPILGVALCLTLFMVGQLFGGVVVDAFGLLGATKVDITVLRAAGCIVAFVGILVVYAGQKRQEARAKEEAAKRQMAAQVADGQQPAVSGFRPNSISPRYVALSFAGGLASAIQTPTNAALGLVTGTLEASTINFLVGFTVLLIATLITNKGRILSMKGQAAWKFTGGVYGAFGVPALITATPILGVSLALGFLMAGQLVGGLAVDAFGWFEARKIQVDRLRIVGAVILLAGFVMVTISRF